MIFLHFTRACCLLLLGCLLVVDLLFAKLVGCTLDTKEGYKTKTGFTSSVTSTAIEYWDQAGGGKKIVQGN